MIRFTIEHDSEKTVEFSRIVTSTTNECLDVSNTLLQDTDNHWTLSTGIYSIFVSVLNEENKTLYSIVVPVHVILESIQISEYTTSTPPRVAPTVMPESPTETNYCGDGNCDQDEDCQSCPLDCGLCNPYACSSSCELPACQCAQTSHPTIKDTSAMPQFVALSWDDAQTPTTFEYMMKVARTSTVVAFHLSELGSRPLQLPTQDDLFHPNEQQSVSVHAATLSRGS